MQDIDNGSFAQFLVVESQIKDNQTLKNTIDEYVQGYRGVGGYNDYFNYGLNTNTWNLFVNKQIMMKYERLFIEKQMNEVKQRKHQLES